MKSPKSGNKWPFYGFKGCPVAGSAVNGMLRPPEPPGLVRGKGAEFLQWLH